MPRRQKILIALVTAMLAVYLADMAYRRLYTQPLLEAQRAIDTLGKRLHKGKLNVRSEQNKLHQLEELRQRSLPSDLELAVSSYRSWLLRVIEQAGLQRTNVDSSPPLRQGNLYYRLDFTVHSSGTLQQITEFLRSFYGCGYLHKIRSMSLNPTAGGTVDSSVTIETLVLPTAKYEDRLAPLETIAASPSGQRYLPGNRPTQPVRGWRSGLVGHRADRDHIRRPGTTASLDQCAIQRPDAHLDHG